MKPRSLTLKRLHHDKIGKQVNRTMARPIAELALVVVTLTLAIGGWRNPIRPFLALLFFFSIPGLPIARRCRFGSIGIQIAIGVAMSTVCATFGAQVLLWTHAWNPTSYVVAISAFTIPFLAVEIATSTLGRKPRHPNFVGQKAQVATL